MKENATQAESLQGGKSDNEAEDEEKKSASDGEDREDSQAEEDKDSQASEEEEENEEECQEGLKSSPEVRRRRPRKD